MAAAIILAATNANADVYMCRPCDAGTYSAAGAQFCTACEADTYAAGEGNTGCANCPTYSTTTALPGGRL
jgi:hypothetical protein